MTHHTTALTPIVVSGTAVPAFIGYTKTIVHNKVSQRYRPVRITSFEEYAKRFGGSSSVSLLVELNADNTLKAQVTVLQPTFLLAYSLQLYFSNGGGPCCIVSAGSYRDGGKAGAPLLTQLQKAVSAAANEEGVTVLVLPDAGLLTGDAYFTLLNTTLQRCATRNDRFAIMDVPRHLPVNPANTSSHIAAFRTGIRNEDLSFGAAYYPWLLTNLRPFVNERSTASIKILGGSGSFSRMVLKNSGRGQSRANSLYHVHRSLYDLLMTAVASSVVALPPGAAIAGIYAMQDGANGVWKAPANIAVSNVTAPAVILTDREAGMLNTDPVSGKSINAIRRLTGRGTVVWGARTLAGNDNEWRYIPVKRFFMMVERSVRTGLASLTFHQNEVGSWIRTRKLVEDFLTYLWQKGAMQGATAGQAFFVKIGLGQTMTAKDIEEGRMIIEIGMSVVRPAEFILLRIVIQLSP